MAAPAAPGPADRAPRRRPRAGGLHSRAVRIATIVLPLAALAVLSTMFLLSRRVDPGAALPRAGVDVSERARDRQVTAPRLSGVSSRGTAFALAAREARPDAADPRRLAAEDLRLVLGDDASGRATIVAAAGEVDTDARRLRLEGDVRITTSTGFDLRTGRLDGSLARLDVTAPGEVRGTGPLGRLRAGSMRIDEAPGGAPRLVFTGGVDLLYLPPT